MIISVIIPTYKDDIRLLKCLDGLIGQTLNPGFFEVIIVNNFPHLSIKLPGVYYSSLNLKLIDEIIPGSYAARNKGIYTAKGDIIAMTDSDCIPDPDWLINAYQYFENDKDKIIGIIAGDVPLFYKNPNALTLAEIYEKYTGFDFFAYTKEGSCGAGNWFSYKSVLKKFGGFDPKLKSNGDTDLSKKISNKYKVIYAPEVIVRHPARNTVFQLDYKYRRLLGGVYLRKYNNRHFRFFGHVADFTWRRFRFSVKKLFTVNFKEALAISIVCMVISIGAWIEYFYLINGSDTKR
ncbi:glycosyltransferase [Anditalea andensis]|uniref:Dolichyl-phosphate mannose synthase-like protein n=1 Tax=Anditalea andensis TaxID=1048983 RepID=A0A074L2D7_9BACT|nr:glycosyltransferase family A protein [Anditalea andensis]KEO74610.1 dolichyl-phosphate mannose synthase-like protein [Anditalea andensis]